MWRTLILILATVLLIFIAIQVIAQTTATSSVDIEYSLLFRPPNDPRPVKFATPKFRWTNTRGSTLAMAGSDTTTVPLASRGKPITAVLADSSMMVRRFGSTQKLWTIAVIDTTRESSDAGTVSLRISDVARGTARDTSIFITAAGLFCADFVIDSMDVVFAPYDSIRAGDRSLLSWTTTQWQ